MIQHICHAMLLVPRIEPHRFTRGGTQDGIKALLEKEAQLDKKVRRVFRKSTKHTNKAWCQEDLGYARSCKGFATQR